MTKLNGVFMKNILICGGAGFIGSHLTKQFIDDGDSVTVFDNNVQYFIQLPIYSPEHG